MLQRALADHQTRLRQGESAAPPSESNESSSSSNNTRRGDDANNAQSKTDQLLKKQQELLEKYEQRLQHLQRQAAGSLADHTVSSQDQGQEERDDTSQSPAAPNKEGERLEFRIPGSAARRITGYSYFKSIYFATGYCLRKILDNRHERLSGAIYSQQQNQRFEADVLRESLPRHAALSTPTTPVTPPPGSDKESPPTPESIAADRQVLHARMLRLSEKLCKVVGANDLPQDEALRGALETLRVTHDSRPITKHEPREPRSWPEWPSNIYQLHNVLERDTKGALLEALKNAQISGPDAAWSLRWGYKVISHFEAEQSTLEYIKSNHQRLVNWTPELQM
ncbi:hypothetical protein SARC_09197 [Sphaeroforma arctica JP610]|uniref:Uncharacterized protein n=1 Tax=Sphaeroforma arctica JP610 TaxID=667725 RepID=A0A0L0FNI3_9EUKA|nr:hypothetical protein SARC_09197 [Sphaeroforma arctica JP610]KNC78375.1 hypothetical protein SARC_09197 [Sphaeroforma arctica JP610]|eukprot:XP_014152277.1 hypothetical protein SARC_09197 [Sphaeroforma arctica JP610]